MDTATIRDEVFRRTGKGIDLDDPFFIAVEVLVLLIEDADKKRMQAVSTAISSAREANQKELNIALEKVNEAVEQVTGAQKNISTSAAHAAREVLMGDAGPVKKLDYLVRKQIEALSWMNRAANFYERAFILWPMVLSATLGALIGGAIVRFL
jgi:hypothetical protein